jgi:polysaccharide biosynthesis/export protein
MSRQLLILFGFILLGLSSCVSHAELINFRSGKEKTPTLAQLPKQEISNLADLKLQTNDVLGIIVSSPDPILSAPYNLVSPQLSVQTSSTTAPNTFIINSDGNITLPSLGTFKALGLSIKELQAVVEKKAATLLENPSVNIRLLNFKVSVMGEVLQPGTFQVDNERITVLEALSRAGDLTPYSNRQHIIVIREHNGIREQGEMDLKDTKFFTSPYYYLQQNDIVYVEPTKVKRWQVQQNTNSFLQPISVGISLLTTLILIFRN